MGAFKRKWGRILMSPAPDHTIKSTEDLKDLGIPVFSIEEARDLLIASITKDEHYYKGMKAACLFLEAYGCTPGRLAQLSHQVDIELKKIEKGKDGRSPA